MNVKIVNVVVGVALTTSVALNIYYYIERKKVKNALLDIIDDATESLEEADSEEKDSNQNLDEYIKNEEETIEKESDVEEAPVETPSSEESTGGIEYVDDKEA